VQRGPDHDVVAEPPGIWMHRGPAPQMPRPHRHDDLELNLVADGRLDYLFGGRPLSVRAGQLALFWAATPHRLVGSEQEPAEAAWLHVPLAVALGWRLPDDALGRLLRDRPVVVDAAPLGDLPALFARWEAERGDDDATAIALLEAQALVRRVLRTAPVDPVPSPGAARAAVSDGVTAMAGYIATRFRDPIRIADVAAVAHLHPSTAMAAFRSALGVTIGAYLARCRVAEAQRLLITSPASVGDIAAASGFGSQSAFYDAFTRETGRSPAAYRRGFGG
jgi:AraC family transcriptional regulator, melibiose operon regulatory protein